MLAVCYRGNSQMGASIKQIFCIPEIEAMFGKIQQALAFIPFKFHGIII